MGKRVIIIHGYGAKPEESWRPWLKRELEEHQAEVSIPAMPNTHHPRVHDWVHTITEVIGRPDTECVLVGHSLGCIAILRYLESLTVDQEIGKVILIAGFYEDLGERFSELRSFIDTPVNWAEIRTHCSDFHVIHSDDDTAVPITFGQSLAKKLGVHLDQYSGYKHFGLEDNITEVPFVLEKIL